MENVNGPHHDQLCRLGTCFVPSITTDSNGRKSLKSFKQSFAGHMSWTIKNGHHGHVYESRPTVGGGYVLVTEVRG